MKSTSVSCGSNSRGLFIGVPREEERDRVVEKYLKKQWPKFVQIQLKPCIHRSETLTKSQVKKHEESYIET